MNALATYIRNVRAEMKHVVWPDWRQAVWHTILIVVISIVVALFITALDYGFQQGVSAALNRGA
jgi:preprotein translocase SecE subunit